MKSTGNGLFFTIEICTRVACHVIAITRGLSQRPNFRQSVDTLDRYTRLFKHGCTIVGWNLPVPFKRTVCKRNSGCKHTHCMIYRNHRHTDEAYQFRLYNLEAATFRIVQSLCHSTNTSVEVLSLCLSNIKAMR